MFSRIHSKFGTAGLVVAIVALVVALTGAAFAAGGGLTSKQKKEVKKIAKQYAGTDGAQGPIGPKGDKGDKGDKGEKGEKGTNGTNGEDGACSIKNPKCVLPKGATETGAFGLGSKQLPGYAALSFNLALAKDPTGIHYVNEAGEEQLTTGPVTFGTPVNCKGAVAEPTAPEGVICLYAGELEGAAAELFLQPIGFTAIYKTGANAFFSGAGLIQGTWAVTGN